MVEYPELEYRYVTADEAELDASLRGQRVEGTVIHGWFKPGLLMAGRTGVLAAVGRDSHGPLQPLALIVHDEDVRRLCGRYATLRSDLSPLSAWCHLLSPGKFENVKGMAHEARFGLTVSAWSGVVVAEAMLLARKSCADLRVSACFATATYAIARSTGLWEDALIDNVLERFDVANRLCRGRAVGQRTESRVVKVRSSLRPVWACLAAVTRGGTVESSERGILPIVRAVMALAEARAARASSEAAMLVQPLLQEVPEAHAFEGLEEMSPEARLRLFDSLTIALSEADVEDSLRRSALALAAGYLATVAAGGTSSLGLVERSAERFPELTTWAYLTGSIGERVTWTSAFDGLGRLVARELARPLRLDESPNCDFALEEAIVLADPGLRDPLVHLRVKQARLVSVALLPGVNVAVPIADATVEEDGSRGERARQDGVGEQVGKGDSRNAYALLAEELWPFIRPKVLALNEHEVPTRRRALGDAGRNRKKKR